MKYKKNESYKQITNDKSKSALPIVAFPGLVKLILPILVFLV